MELYHYTLGFPSKFNPNVGTIKLEYSVHAKSASQTDRYGAIQLPGNLKTGSASCIELGLENGAVQKLVYRVSYSDTLDLCIVVAPRQGHFKVLTVWLNLKVDQHETLNASKYVNLRKAA
jgi:hypothetical protein